MTTVALLEAGASRDGALVERLARLINDVYAIAERGLWRDGAMRTTARDLAELIREREIAVATREERIVGCIRIHDISASTAEFGMLVAAPDTRGSGVGRALLDFAEEHARRRGRRAMRLELLVPRAWSHPSKTFLKAWYGRNGYRVVRTDSMDDAYPHLAPLLATPCDLEVHEKPLHS
jgi:GNAT superfamily N-acetyltransferase